MSGHLLDTPSLEVLMPTPLERAIARFRRRADKGDTRTRISAAEFRAATEQRLRSLGDQLLPPEG